MIAEDEPRERAYDEALEKELEGVPADLRDNSEADEDGASLHEEQSGLADELAALREELAAARQDVLYARADTQNVRRRMEKDISDARAYAATGFARDILSVSDNLARALDAVPADLIDDGRVKGLIAGIQATRRELDKVFGQHGITRVAAMGLPLDPNCHQAMLEVPTADAEPGTIVQEMQTGYMIKDRLLRPAMVAVARKPD